MTTRTSSGGFTARAVLNAGALVFAASMVLSVGGFVFHALATRRLGPAQYGELYALISVYTLATFPVSLLTPVITKFAAEFGALHDESHLRGLVALIVRSFAVFGVAYIVLGLVLARPIGTFIHIVPWQVSVLGLMAAIGTFSAALRAIAQGIHDYARYGFSMMGEGIGKVAFLVLLSLGGLTVIGGIAGFILGMAVGAMIVGVPLLLRYRRVAAAPIHLHWSRIVATTAGAASLTLTTTLVGFGDVILVKHYFSARDAGMYAAASLCAKILLYFVGFVPSILIPQATHRHARGEQTRKVVGAALGFVAIVAVIGIAFYSFFGTLLLHALVGSAFDAAKTIVPMYASAMGVLGLTGTIGSYAIATHRLAFVVPLVVAVAATLAWIAVAHATLTSVTQELFIGNLAMFAAVATSVTIQGLRSVRARA